MVRLSVGLVWFVLLSLVFQVSGNCRETEVLVLREEYQVAYRIPANVNGCDQRHHRCGGDMYIAENPLLSASGRRLGTMDSVCTAMPTLDRASCRWTMYMEHTDSEIQVSGVSYGQVENSTEVMVLGGAGDYLGVTGSGSSFVVSGATERWFQLSLCYPDDGPGSGCRFTEMTMEETGTINDVLVLAIPGRFTTGAKDLFSNQLSVADNSLGITYGSDDGQCLFINQRWLCQWNTLLPDERNKIFIQGSIASRENVPAIVPIIGGTGKFMSARGNATVTARKSSHQNTYYWETKVELSYNCTYFPKTQRVSFRQYVGNGTVIPSRAAPGKNPPNPGDVRVFIDDLRTMSSKRSEPVDGTATGTCTELNFNDKHYCEWIIQYPVSGVPNTEGSSQIFVVGTVSDDPDADVSTVGVVGGSGLWAGAQGYGNYQAASFSIDDDDVGSVVGTFNLEFSYYGE